MGNTDNFVAERQQTFCGLRGILKRRKEEKSRRRKGVAQRGNSEEFLW